MSIKSSYKVTSNWSWQGLCWAKAILSKHTKYGLWSTYGNKRLERGFATVQPFISTTERKPKNTEGLEYSTSNDKLHQGKKEGREGRQAWDRIRIKILVNNAACWTPGKEGEMSKKQWKHSGFWLPFMVPSGRLTTLGLWPTISVLMFAMLFKLMGKKLVLEWRFNTWLFFKYRHSGKISRHKQFWVIKITKHFKM